MKLSSSQKEISYNKERFKHPCLVFDKQGCIYLTIFNHSTSIDKLDDQIECNAVIVGGNNGPVGYYIKELNLEYCEPYYGTISLNQTKG